MSCENKCPDKCVIEYVGNKVGEISKKNSLEIDTAKLRKILGEYGFRARDYTEDEKSLLDLTAEEIYKQLTAG